MAGQRRGQGTSVIIDDQDLALNVGRVACLGQVSKEEFVGGIPGTERFVRMRWIAREFEFALGHPQPCIGSARHASSANRARPHRYSSVLTVNYEVSSAS